MLRTKLLTLTCIATLALGMSAPASADPITVNYTATQIAPDPFTGDQIFDLDFSVIFNANCEATLAGCDFYYDGLWAIDVFFDFFNVLEVITVGDLFDNSSTPDPALFDGWASENFGDSAGYFIDLGFEVLPGATFGFQIIVNVGDAFVDTSFDFLDTLFDPFAFYWGDNVTDMDVFVSQTALTLCEFECDPATVPEPGTLVLFGLGLFGLAAARRRRQI